MSRDCEKKFVEAFKELGDLCMYRALLAYGIVNPAGPTMNILATLNDWRNKSSVPVYLLQLHPFYPEILRKWTIPAEKSVAIKALNAIIDDICNDEELGSSCPTLFVQIFGGTWPLNDTTDLLVRIVASKEGGVETFEKCKRFAGKPFDRIAYDMTSTEDTLRRYHEKMHSLFENASENDDPFALFAEGTRELYGNSREKLSREDAKQFIKLQSEFDCQVAELQAFFKTYIGSLTNAVLPVKLTFEDFFTMYEAIVLGRVWELP